MSQIKLRFRSVPKWVWLICLVFLILQYLICLNVFVMGDDFMYGSFGHQGVISPIISYYRTGNGRWFVNTIDCLLLLFDRYLFHFLAPWLLLLLAALLFKLVSQLTGAKDYRFFGLAIGLLSSIDIQMTCETTYWITGAMNYLLPAILLLGGMISTLWLSVPDQNGKRAALCGIVCVLSCVAMEQFSLMSLGWMLLIWGFDWFRSKTIRKRNLVIFLLSAAAFCTIFFAPGNFTRVAVAANNSNPILVKLMDLLYYDYYSRAAAPFFFILSSLVGVRFWRSGKIIMSLLSLLNAAILLVLFDYGLINYFAFLPFGAVLFLSIVLSAVTLLPGIASIVRRMDIIWLFSLAVIGVGSQVILLGTDLWGFRTSFSWILVLLVLGLLLMDNMRFPNSFGYFASLLCMPVHPILGIVGAVLASICLFSKKPRQTLCTGVLLFSILMCLRDEVIGYQKNRDVQISIIRAAENAASDNEFSTVIIHPYDEKQYGWNSPPFSEFHEKYFRSYYGIPEGDDIIYE